MARSFKCLHSVLLVCICIRTAVISCPCLAGWPGQRPLQRLGHYGLHLAKLPVRAGWQHSSLISAVNIHCQLLTHSPAPQWCWHCHELSAMLDHEPPGDRICDKLNEENCDDTRVVSSVPLIEDTAPSNNTHFFEGVEKNLEVWFTSSNGDTDHSDLRLIPR